MPSATRQKEAPIQAAIIRHLQIKRIFFWRVNAGLTIIKGKHKERAIKGAPNGTPDIVGAYQGRMFAIEVKSSTGKLTLHQQRWHETAAAHGVLVGVARSVPDAASLLRGWFGI